MRAFTVAFVAALLMIGASSVSAQNVYLSAVDTISGGLLPVDQTIDFEISYNAGGSENIKGVTNGFRVYSSDNPSLDWDTTTCVLVEGVLATNFDLVWSLNVFPLGGPIGEGEDTVGVQGAVMFNATGMPSDYDSLAATITVGPISSSGGFGGNTVCIDSSFYQPNIEWKWSGSATAIITPDWGGPYCFAIEGGSDVDRFVSDQLPDDWSLSQNYPNPFNPTTEIEFAVPTASWVTLTVYNVLGQRVVDLVDENLSAGRYTASWDGRSNSGTDVSSGVYFYRLESRDFTETKKMMLIK